MAMLWERLRHASTARTLEQKNLRRSRRLGAYRTPYGVGGRPGCGPVSMASEKRITVVSTFSEKVRANWPAKMSHSPHGECDDRR